MNDDAMRGHIVVSATPPATEAGRLWHDEWHSGDYPGAPSKCGSMGCGFLIRVLAVEAAMRSACTYAGGPQNCPIHYVQRIV
jgi:hypothetical protein